MKIDDAQEQDYELVRISNLGFVDDYGIEGLLLLKADDGREFHMHAFQARSLDIYLVSWMNNNLFLLSIKCLKRYVKKMGFFW